jgi:chorismate dehydratase
VITVGIIDYLNTQPIYYTFAQKLGRDTVNLVHNVPSALNQALVAGNIDIAPVSSIVAAQMADAVFILPGLSIAALGSMQTVLLFSWHPDPKALDGLPIALTDHSATSVALFKLLCRDRYQIQPFDIHFQDLTRMMCAYEAALIIGDQALIEGSQHRKFLNPRGEVERPYIIDLGDEWLKHSGLPFVFALWAVRRERAEELVAAGIHWALWASKADGLASLTTLAAEYAAQLKLPVGLCTRYLRDLRYDLTQQDRKGLTRFLDTTLPNRRPLVYLNAEI